MKPSVCIVIVNFNGVEYVRHSIESALSQRYGGLIQVVVVDNDSTDGSRKFLRTLESIVLIEQRNAGYGSGANRGSLAIEADYVAFLNPDAVADIDWLATLVPWMQEREIDFATSIVRAGTGTYFAGGRFVAPLGTTLLDVVPRARTDWLSGCALVARSEAFRTIGGFDEQFFLYYEDVDLSLRASGAGYTLAVFPRALVDHPSHGMSTNRLGRRKAEISYASRGRLIAKHVRAWRQPLALIFTATISPLLNAVSLRDLPKISLAVARGFAAGRSARSRAAKPTIGILANIFEQGAGIRAGGHLHFIEVVKRWKHVKIVLFGPEIARADMTAALPDAEFVALPFLYSLQDKKSIDFLYRSFAALRRLRALRRCDAFMATSHLLPDVLPALLARKPFAVVIHHLITSKTESTRRPSLPSVLGERLSLLLIRYGARCAIAGSPLMLRELRARHFNMPAVVTTNGVDHLHFPPVTLDDSGRSGAVFVGRLHPSKNPLDAIRAWALVVERFPRAQLTIIGAAEIPEYAETIRRSVAELDLEANVQFTGAVSDADKVRALIAAKLFLFPSKEEGWGIAVAEAMRAGLPCVTYDLPIFREVFPIGRCHAPMDDVTALAGHVANLLGDEALRRRYAAEAASLAQTFTWERASQVESEALAALLA